MACAKFPVWCRSSPAPYRKFRFFHEPANEMIELRTQIGLIRRTHRERKNLKQLHAGARSREDKDVLVGLERMSFGQASNVGRIIKQPLALDLNQTWLILPDALQTRPTNRSRVGTPVSRRQFTKAVGADGDAAVDNRCQVGVGDEVEQMAAVLAQNSEGQRKAGDFFATALRSRA